MTITIIKFTENDWDILINCIDHRMYYLTHIETKSEKRKEDIARQLRMLEGLENKCEKAKTH